MTKKKLPRHVRRHRGKFRAVLRVDGRTFRSEVFDDPADAHAWALDLRRAEAPSHGPLTLQQGFEHLLGVLRARNMAAATVEHYEKHWAIVTGEHGWGCGLTLNRVEPGQVYRYVERRTGTGKVSLETVWTKEVQVLERVLNQCVDDGILRQSPLARLKKPKLRHKRFDYMPAETIENLLAAVLRYRSPSGRGLKTQQRDHDIIAALWLTGVRRSELARMKREHVDEHAGVLHVIGKNANRTLPVTARVRAILDRAALRAGAGPLFGKVRLIETVLEKWRRRLGESKLAPHVLRHSFATFHANNGVPLFDLMTLLGHKSPAQTARYYHGDAARLRGLLEGGEHGHGISDLRSSGRPG